jgi:hypothetical protein
VICRSARKWTIGKLPVYLRMKAEPVTKIRVQRGKDVYSPSIWTEKNLLHWIWVILIGLVLGAIAKRHPANRVDVANKSCRSRSPVLSAASAWECHFGVRTECL